jgi:hypothetical protein
MKMRPVRYALLTSSFLGAAMVLLPLDLASAAQSAITFNKVAANFQVLQDGTYTEIEHAEVLARTAAAARDVGVVNFAYDELTTDGVAVTDAYTLKSDGTKLPVDASAIYTQAAPGSDTITSMKQKVIVFPRVTAGDAVVYTIKSHLKTPTFPGWFSLSNVLFRTISYNDWSGSISAPSSMPLKIDTHGISVDEEERGNTVHYYWHYAAPNALGEDLADIALIDRNPRLFVSSFASYDELGRTYAEMIAPALAVTPKIQAQADRITAGITDRRKQAEMIYDWVGQNIRYVSIQLGVGGYMPHAADAVLANGYGDCKDHTVLLAALLKAKGIESDVVAINLANSYTVPAVPSFASFNHAINWLPEFNLYVDSTIGVAPFGSLAFEEYGKPVVHAVSSGNALRKTPIVAAGEASLQMKTTAKLDADGDITGKTSTVGSGPFGVTLRISAEGVEAKATTDLPDGGTRSYDFGSPTQPGREFKMIGRFDISRPEYLTGVAFSIPFLSLLQPGVKFLMGPIANVKLKDSEPTSCFTGASVEEASLELPDGKHLLKLPPNITIADDHLRYTTRWTVNGHVVSLRIEFVSLINQPLCSGDVRKSVAKDFAQIRQASQTQVLSLADDDTALKSASDETESKSASD